MAAVMLAYESHYTLRGQTYIENSAVRFCPSRRGSLWLKPALTSIAAAHEKCFKWIQPYA